MGFNIQAVRIAYVGRLRHCIKIWFGGGAGTRLHSVGGAIFGGLVGVALSGSMWDCESETTGGEDWAS